MQLQGALRRSAKAYQQLGASSLNFTAGEVVVLDSDFIMDTALAQNATFTLASTSDRADSVLNRTRVLFAGAVSVTSANWLTVANASEIQGDSIFVLAENSILLDA